MISLIDPKERFNKTISEHKKDRLDPDSKPVYPMDYDLPFEYLCSKCNYKVSIKNPDLEKHSGSDFSNLNDLNKKQIDEYVKSKQLDSFSYIDFKCPKCDRSIRILYDSEAGGFFGMTYELKHVIEMNN